MLQVVLSEVELAISTILAELMRMSERGIHRELQLLWFEIA